MGAWLAPEWDATVPVFYLTLMECTEAAGVRDRNPDAFFLNGVGFASGKPLHYNSGPINLKKALHFRKGSQSAGSARWLKPRIPACVWLKALPPHSPHLT